jgi:hypothetical protein
MRRPDLLEKADLSDEDKKLLGEVIEQNREEERRDGV